MHLWEEGRFPGGFMEMITEHLHFTAISRTIGEIQGGLCVGDRLRAAVSPARAVPGHGRHDAWRHAYRDDQDIPGEAFLLAGPVTTVFLLLPISLYNFAYVIQQNLMQPISWLLAFLYMLFGLVIAQLIVIRTSGMKYIEFLKNVRAAAFGDGTEVR